MYTHGAHIIFSQSMHSCQAHVIVEYVHTTLQTAFQLFCRLSCLHFHNILPPRSWSLQKQFQKVILLFRYNIHMKKKIFTLLDHPVDRNPLQCHLCLQANTKVDVADILIRESGFYSHTHKCGICDCVKKPIPLP